ncbi:MAG: hypothetical protein AAGA29_12700 [Planctomycetota bacterium]
MHEYQVNTIARVFGGRPWQPYPGVWLLVVARDDGSLVVFDSDAVYAYDNTDALEDGEPRIEIRLNPT